MKALEKSFFGLLIAFSATTPIYCDFDLDELKEKFSIIEKAQNKCLTIIQGIENDDIFKKYRDDKYILSLKRWSNTLIKNKRGCGSHYVLDTRRWLKYSVLERLRFSIEEEEFERINQKIDYLITFAKENLKNGNCRDLNQRAVVTAEVANLRNAPFLKDRENDIGETTKKTTLEEGDSVRVKYMIKSNTLHPWAYVETEDGTKGWISSGLLKIQKSF